MRIPDIVFCREASLLTTAVASEVDEVRLEIDQGLGAINGPSYRLKNRLAAVEATISTATA